MAYLGSGMEEVEKTVATVNMVCDTMTGDGSTATMTIGASQEMPGHVNNVSIYFDGVAQRPTTDYTLSGKTVTFSTAPETSVNVVCLSYASEYLDVISDATVYGAEILDGALTDAKIASGIASSKLTGALPAIDGSAVTNYGPRAVTKSASDPVITTNPANGVGTVWANTTSGEMYVCTDATTDENVWINIGPGAGDIALRIAGYVAGGGSDVSAGKSIERFTFGSMSSATEHGDLTVVKSNAAGHSSTTHGFVSGAFTPSSITIDRFSFSTSGNSTDVGNLTVARGGGAGTHSTTQGYSTGGNVSGSYVNTIDKFTFSASVTSSSHGNIAVGKAYSAGISSSTHGFMSGGYSGGSTDYNTIDKMTFASNVTAADHGDLTQRRYACSGTYSTTDGYTSGGYQRTPGGFQNVIDKFSFASNAGAADHGDLTSATDASSGMSSTTDGYAAGSQVAGSIQTIHKFSFGASNNATNHGDLTKSSTYNSVGTHF